MRKSRLAQVNLLAQDHAEVNLAHWEVKNQVKRIFVTAYTFLISPSTSENEWLFLRGSGVSGMSTPLLSCEANGTFLGGTPSGAGTVALKAESEAVNALKVHGLELRGSQASRLFAVCSHLSEAGQALIREPLGKSLSLTGGHPNCSLCSRSFGRACPPPQFSPHPILPCQTPRTTNIANYVSLAAICSPDSIFH